MSVQTSQIVINEFNYQNNIAFLAESEHKIHELIVSNLNSKLFSKVLSIKLNQLNKINNKFKLIFTTIFLEKKLIQKNVHLLKQYNVDRIFLTTLQDINEKILYLAGRKLKLEINNYEEGTTQFINNSKYYSTQFYFKHKLKYLMSILVSRSFLNLNTPTYLFHFNRVFSTYPEMYIGRNFKEIITVPFGRYLKIDNLLKKSNFKNHYLYVSRPLSEENIINLREELEILSLIQKKFEKVIFKFHPRESNVKKNLIKNRFRFDYLSQELSNIPAEKLIINYEFKGIIGLYSNTIYFAHRFSNLAVYSTVKLIGTDNLRFKVNKKLLLNNLTDINYL